MEYSTQEAFTPDIIINKLFNILKAQRKNSNKTAVTARLLNEAQVCRNIDELRIRRDTYFGGMLR